jgi:hypothetical protein
MSPKSRRNFSGAFLPQDRGKGAWQLSRPAPQEINVFLRGAERSAERSFATGPLVDLGIEWHEEKVLLTFMSQETVASVEAASAIVHEPLERLYERLPMVSIDACITRNRAYCQFSRVCAAVLRAELLSLALNCDARQSCRAGIPAH